MHVCDVYACMGSLACMGSSPSRSTACSPQPHHSAKRAGFPTICPNVVYNATFVREQFPDHDWGVYQPVMHRIGADLQIAPMCSSNDASRLDPACVGDYCRGLPTTFRSCVDAAGIERFKFGMSGAGDDGSIGPTALVHLTLSLASACQILIFVLVAPMGDYGTLRKKYLTGSTLSGSVALMCLILVTPETYWLGCALLILSNVMFGLSQVIMYAYLPVLLSAIPDQPDKVSSCCSAGPLDVWSRLPSIAAGSSARELIRTHARRGDEISNAGFAFGYFAGMTSLICFMPFFFLSRTQSLIEEPVVFLGYQLVMVGAGLWWVGFYYITWRGLLPRPGPWSPADDCCSIFTKGVFHFRDMVREACRAQSVGMYLIIWFIFSDGVLVCGSIAVLFADAEVEWGCIPKGIGMWALTVISCLCAGIGSTLATRIQAWLRWTSKSMLIASLCLIVLVPLWGVIGLLKGFPLGLKYGWELLVLGVVYGGALGPMQGYSRVLFGLMIPEGAESSYFAIYQVTDKGSSFCGPLVVSAITQATGSQRHALLYAVVMIVIGIIALVLFDVDKAVADRKRREMEQEPGLLLEAFALPDGRQPGGTTSASDCDPALLPVGLKVPGLPSAPAVQPGGGGRRRAMPPRLRDVPRLSSVRLTRVVQAGRRRQRPWTGGEVPVPSATPP